MTDEFNLAVSRAGLGLIEAFARFNVSRNAQLYEHTAISATEAAMWIVALDDLHLRWLPDVADYRARRDCDEDGRVVRGITWARNEGVHALIFRHEWTDEPGLIFSAGEGRDAGINFSVGEGRDAGMNAEWFVRWASVPDKLRPTKKEPIANFEGYRSYLQGRWVHLTLQAAAQWFGVGLR